MALLTELFPSVRVSQTSLKGASKRDIGKVTLREPEQEWHSQVSPRPAAPPVPTWRALGQALQPAAESARQQKELLTKRAEVPEQVTQAKWNDDNLMGSVLSGEDFREATERRMM